MNKMTKIAFASILTMFMSGAALADDYFEDCIEDKAEYEQKLGYAQQMNNTNAINKYQFKLNKLSYKCSGTNPLNAMRKAVAKYERDVYKQEQEVRKEEIKLQQAELSGNIRKIIKYRSEVIEERAELAEDMTKLQWAREQLALLIQQGAQ